MTKLLGALRWVGGVFGAALAILAGGMWWKRKKDEAAVKRTEEAIDREYDKKDQLEDVVREHKEAAEAHEADSDNLDDLDELTERWNRRAHRRGPK